MNGFIATITIAGSFLLVAKLIIDYASPRRKTVSGPANVRANVKHFKLYVHRAVREAEKLEKHASAIE
jgi:hypothetical protein